MNKKKALVAVAHTLLMVVYHLLSHRVRYAELGSDHVDRLHVERQRRRLVTSGASLLTNKIKDLANWGFLRATQIPGNPVEGQFSYFCKPLISLEVN